MRLHDAGANWRTSIVARKLRSLRRIWRNFSIGDMYSAALDAYKRGDEVTMQWHLERASELAWKLNQSVPF